MTNGVIKTKFGNAKIQPDGYYAITSGKEGNFSKKLHRLIFEDFYQSELPNDWIIHHEDGNKLNNEIWNLVPMTRREHQSLHTRSKQYAKGNILSNDTRRKMSIQRNTTGYRNVSINKKPECKQGFYYRYGYRENGKRKVISSVDINELKRKVLAKGLIWEEYSQDEPELN